MVRLPTILALACGLAACHRASPDQRSVVLVTLDTTRCDALDGFGGARHVTPELDRLARESVRYLEARTVAPLTLPAHASMLTGLYPPRHGARDNGPAMLPPEATSVAELAQRAGFQTAAFVGGLTLDRAYGIAQGFEAWTQPEPEANRERGEVADRPASEVVRDARAWLAKRDRERPFFLWVHVFDAHAPYAPPPEALAKAGEPYYGEVAAMDAALGELFADLRGDGTLEHSTLIVLADHGESLGEHGEETHGLLVYDSTLRVPFFVRHPDGERAGEESRELVSVVDVAPTVLDAMGLGLPRDLDGLSLIHDRVPQERGLYFECFAGWARFGWAPLVGWIDAQGELVHEVGIAPPPTSVGYERFGAGIRAVFAAPRIEPRAAPSDRRREQRIAELGYGAKGEGELVYPDPFTLEQLPRPDMDEYAALCGAQKLAREGKSKEAIAMLEFLLSKNPRNLEALDELALALIAQKEWNRARDVLLERLRHPPERLAAHQGLVQCFTELGEPERAREHTLRALELLIALHERRGERAEAERYRAIYQAGLKSAGR